MNHPDDFDEERSKVLLEKAYRRAYRPQGNQRHLLAMISADPRGDLLKSVTIPSLIIHGDYDPVVPCVHGSMADCLPESQLHVIERMGHGLPPRVCQRVIGIMVPYYQELSRRMADDANHLLCVT